MVIDGPQTYTKNAAGADIFCELVFYRVAPGPGLTNSVAESIATATDLKLGINRPAINKKQQH